MKKALKICVPKKKVSYKLAGWFHLDMMFPFKMVFITFFTAPDVCGDVWKYVAGMGLHYTLNVTLKKIWPPTWTIGLFVYWMRDIPALI